MMRHHLIVLAILLSLAYGIAINLRQAISSTLAVLF